MSQTTIHKKNEFIRGTDDFSVLAKRAMNSVYWVYQKNNLFKHDEISLKFSTLRKLMKLETDNRYIEKIKDALVELKQPIQLNHFYHPIAEVKYQWYLTSFIDSAGFRKNTKIDEWVCDIKISSLTKYIMQKEGNFTPLDLMQYANKFRTKHGMKTYEYLKSFKGYGYLDITQNHLMKLLSLEQNSKYKYYSNSLQLLERIVKDISSKTDLKYAKIMKSPALKKDKKFRIIINPKSRKQADDINAKSVLDSLIKRF